MGRYIKSFENDAAIQSAVDNGVLSKPYVAYDESANTIDWNSKAIDYSKMPLTFEIISGGTLLTRTQSSGDHIIEYSLNGGEWREHHTNQTYTDFVICNVNAGDIVKFRSSGATITNSSNYYGLMIYSPNNTTYNIYGNIMSLINPTEFQNLTSVPDYAFVRLFGSSNQPATNVIGVENLILPATTLGKYCYYGMFLNQTNITGKAPELPATTLTEYCYGQMFDTGTGLHNSKLNYIKCLATDISRSDCTQGWIRGVASTGTFVKPSSTDWSIKTGNDGIPTNWTVIDA